MAIPLETILKAVLFIGLLLLCTGIYYYNFDPMKEGFQSHTWDQTKCDVSGTVEYCNSQCGADKVTIVENPDEQLSYDIYEAKNLVSPPLNEPLPKVPTTNTIFNSASSLSPFDFNPSNPTSIPWDFDNSTLNPAYTLWGVVPPQVSQLIFGKAEAQYACGDIKNLYIDPNSSRVQYQTQYFNTIVYDPTQIVLYEFADNFIDFYAEQVFETVIDSSFIEPVKRAMFINKAKKAAKAAELTKAIAFRRTQLGLAENAPVSATVLANAKLDAKKAVQAREALGEFERAWETQDAIRKWEKNANSTFISIYKTASREGMAPIEGIKAVVKSFFSMGVVGVTAESAGIRAGVNSNIVKDLEALTELREVAASKEILGSASIYRYLEKPIGLSKNLLHAIRPGKIITAVSKFKTGLTAVKTALKEVSASLVRKLANKIGARLIAEKAIMAVARIAGAIEGMFDITSILAPIAPPIGMIIAVFLEVLILCCITVIPAMFNAFIDINTAQCPYGSDGIQMSNMYDSIVYSSSAGPIGWNILTAIPGFGDITYAFAPYLCFAVTDAQRSSGAVKLKTNLVSPAYYEDPTLSLYSVLNKPQFLSGSGYDDPRLNNPAKYHD